MRIANLGILLLTVMVVTKYVISLHAFGTKDGSFKSGIVLDYQTIRYEIAELKSRHVNDRLLAFNSLDEFETNLASYQPETHSNAYTGSDFNTSPAYIETAVVETNITWDFEDEPLPMDHRNSLVVYDLANPSNSLVSSVYDDVEDDIPLDNGNTIISGMMQVIPRR
jgi:hypothetical protein